MDITLGLDFGTHQSKLCLSYMLNTETVYEFVEFKLEDGSKSVLFPSVIQINQDDTLRFGSFDYSSCATRPIAPPIPPVLPACPCELPKEPDMKFPPKPTLEGPSPDIVDKTDWLGALKSIKASYNEDVKTPEFEKKLKIWNDKCREIKNRHDAWVRDYTSARKLLDSWKLNVENLKAEYDSAYTAWQKHSADYRIFRYFKQATYSETMPWPKDEIPAQTLSVWYLTYILLLVKEYVQEKFHEVFEESVSIQMGVPAGMNDNVSRMIKYRGQRLLVTARHLMELFGGAKEMLSIHYQDLLELTKEFNGNVIEEAESLGVVVKPEAYAGLQSLTYSQRLSRGNMHLLVDIGGGTTDIVFFTIDKERLPEIHTVASFHKGLNYVLEQFSKRCPEYTMGQAQELLRSDINMFSNEIKVYKKALREKFNDIIEHVIREFNTEMAGTDISTNQLVAAMIGRPIVYCGGGSVFPQMRVGQSYFSDQRLIDKETLNIPNLLNRNLPPVYYTILATAYGLSIPTIEEIHTIDARQLWRVVADRARKPRDPHEYPTDYGLSDD